LEDFSENEFKEGVKVMLIKRFVFSNEAYLAAASLKAAGIKCFVGNSTMGTLVPFSEGSFTLHINQTDQAAAIALLADFENSTAIEDEDFRDANKEDIEYEKEVREQEELVEKASPKMAIKLLIALLIFTVIFFLIKNRINL